MNPKIEIFETPFEVAGAFAEKLIKLMKQKVDQYDSFNVSLSGGNTPKLLFNILKDKYKERIDWSKINFFWGDERCVPPTDEQSNYNMTKENLFNFVDIKEENIYRIKGEDDPEKEAERYANLLTEKLPEKNGLPLFDLMILGAGEDGHTASIFPNQIDKFYSENLCVTAEHPETRQKRISLTGKIINNSATVVFLVTGENKAKIISCILRKCEGWDSYPISKVDPINGDLLWFLDKAAAKFL